MRIKFLSKSHLIWVALALLAGCKTYPDFIPSSGPNREHIEDTTSQANELGIRVVEVTDSVTRQIISSQKQNTFSELWGNTAPNNFVVKPGDILEVSIWEAPPAMLFASAGSVAASPLASATSGINVFPTQMVNEDGVINIPFAGSIDVVGQTPSQIEKQVAAKLKGKANQPQVLVRIAQNNSANVTVVGDVNVSLRMPLTPRGERLLDALAAAGGVKDPVNKMTLQVTRGEKVQSLPLDLVIRDPKQNIVLQPGDVVTSLFQSNFFTVLGATGTNNELNFEAQGISLAQALARSGGLNDARSDAKGVFIFRLESPRALNVSEAEVKTTPEGKVPVIYRVDLKDPAMFFVAQSFPIQNRDVLYVSNASGAEFQKFLNIIVSAVYPVANIVNAIAPYRNSF